MGALAAVERFLERLFEGQSARLFRTRLRPIQVQRRIERTMESRRARDGHRTVVPHRFVVRLSPDDLTALRATSPGLAAGLADGALAFARAHGYTLLDRPTVTLRADTRMNAGSLEVDVAAAPSVAMSDANAADSEGDAAGEGGGGPRFPAPAGTDATAVFSVPRADGPRATIREIRPDRTTRDIEIDGRALTIGRAPDNGVVVRDARASRHHARIDIRRGSLVLTDLGSTNGSWVNDRRVESVALGVGDRVRIGTTTLVVESVDETRRDATTTGGDAAAEGRSTTDGAASAG